MTLNSVANSAAAHYTYSSASQKYADSIREFYVAQPYKTRDEINAEDTALQQFKNDLMTKGASQFIADLDQEKIEALVEEYRQKLLEEQKNNPDKPMDIDQMVSDFRKQLLEQIMQASQNDRDDASAQNTLLMSRDILAQSQAMRSTDQQPGTADIGFLSQLLSTAEAVSVQKNEEYGR